VENFCSFGRDWIEVPPKQIFAFTNRIFMRFFIPSFPWFYSPSLSLSLQFVQRRRRNERESEEIHFSKESPHFTSIELSFEEMFLDFYFQGIDEDEAPTHPFLHGPRRPGSPLLLFRIPHLARLYR